MRDEHVDKRKPSYPVICWRSLTSPVNKTRIVTLERSGGYMRHRGWWDPQAFAAELSKSKEEVEAVAAAANASLDQGCQLHEAERRWGEARGEREGAGGSRATSTRC